MENEHEIQDKEKEFFSRYLPSVLGLNVKVKENKITFLHSGCKIRIRNEYGKLCFYIKLIGGKYRCVVKLEMEEQNSWFSNTIRFTVLSMISNAKLYGIKTKYKDSFLFYKEYRKYIINPPNYLTTKINTAMKDLTKVFLDLSKCSEEQQKHIIKITGISEDYIKYLPFVIFDNDRFETCNSWWVNRMELTELTYSQFIRLFEGGEGENIDYKSEFEKLKSLVMSDSVFWCLRRGIKYPSDFDFDDVGYIELNKWIKANSNQ